MWVDRIFGEWSDAELDWSSGAMFEFFEVKFGRIDLLFENLMRIVFVWRGRGLSRGWRSVSVMSIKGGGEYL